MEFKVTLVIPVRNEEDTIQRILDSVAQQSRLPDELIIVDGGSTDGTVSLAREFNSGRMDFRIIEAGDATPGRGRNIGIAAARHEWIALTDAGIKLQKDWLENLVRVAQSDAGPDVVYGNFKPQVRSSFEQYAALTYVPAPRSVSGTKMRGPSIASCILRHSVWRRTGGFPDWRAAEDLYFIDRIRESEFKVAWAPEATVLWQLQPTLAATFRRFALYSCHNVWAGRQWDWHYGVAKIYAACAPFMLLALFHRIWWLSVPLTAGLARTAKSIWKRCEGPRLREVVKPIQFLMVAVILVTIDLAMFIGWARALLSRRAETLSPAASPDTLQP